MAKTPTSTDKADETMDAIVSIKTVRHDVVVEATYEDAFGVRTETHRFEDVNPKISGDEISKLIAEKYT